MNVQDFRVLHFGLGFGTPQSDLTIIDVGFGWSFLLDCSHDEWMDTDSMKLELFLNAS